MVIYLAVLVVTVVVASLPRVKGGLYTSPSRASISTQPGLLAFFLVFAFLGFMSAARWRVGADYSAYEYNFNTYAMADIGALLPFGEPGIRIIAKVGDAVGLDSIFMFGAAAVITVGLCVWTIARASPSFVFGAFLFVTLGAWAGSFNAVRQYIAAAIIFAAYKLILDRRLAAYCGVLVVAALFHVSALVLILLYFVPRKKMGLGAISVLLLVTVLASTSYEFLFDAFGALADKTPGVVTDYATEEVHPLRIVFWAIPVVILALVSRTDHFTAADFFFANILIINLAVWIMSAGSAYIARLAIYTTLFAVVGIPRLFNAEKDELNALAKWGTVLAASGFWLYGLVISVHLRPYQRIWDSPQWKYLLS